MPIAVLNETIKGFESKEARLKLYEDLQKIIEEHRDTVGAPIRIMQMTQELCGYLPKQALEIISDKMDLSLSHLYSILTFYHYFSTVPKGKYVIQVCKGTACYVKGGQKILSMLKKSINLEPGGITGDGRFSLEIVRCLGACGMSPVMAINEDVHGRVKPSTIVDILAAYK
jgi:NADH:ubiquinone oxidoreductase subunit E